MPASHLLEILNMGTWQSSRQLLTTLWRDSTATQRRSSVTSACGAAACTEAASGECLVLCVTCKARGLPDVFFGPGRAPHAEWGYQRTALLLCCTERCQLLLKNCAPHIMAALTRPRNALEAVCRLLGPSDRPSNDPSQPLFLAVHFC